MNKVTTISMLTGSDNILEGCTNPVQPKIKRRVRTATITIGLVVSIGVCNLLMTRQSDRALAVKLTSNEPTLSAIPIAYEVPRRKSICLIKPEAAISPSPFSLYVRKVSPDLPRLGAGNIYLPNPCSGPHSHFELHLQGKGVVNPIAYLPR